MSNFSVNQIGSQGNLNIPKQPSTEVIDEHKLIELVNETIKNDFSSSQITQIRNYVSEKKFSSERIQNILINNGFKIEKAREVAANIWNHGAPMTRVEAEKMLENSPIGTWLVRYSDTVKGYVVSCKKEVNYEHKELVGLKEEDIEHIKSGYSTKFSDQYPIQNMILTSDLLKYADYGNKSTDDVKNILQSADNGSWILRYSDAREQYYLAVRIPDDPPVKYISIGPKGPNLPTNIQYLNDQIKSFESKNKIKLHPYGKGMRQKQIELTVKHLFSKKLMKVGGIKNFEKQGVVKISRERDQSGLPSSYIIKNLGQKIDSQGDPMYDESNLPIYDIKIYKVVHGPEGRLGKGEFKEVKLWIEDVTNERLARAKFIDWYEARDSKIPHLKKIYKALEGLENVATGEIVTVEKKDGTLSQSILLEYALCNLMKALFKGVKGKPLDHQMKLQLAKQLLTGLAAMHERGVAHCDLKLDNINVYEDPSTHKIIVKISDLDLAKLDGGVSKGSSYYMAPELCDQFVELESLQNGDVFSMGIVLSILLNADQFFESNDDEDFKDFIDSLAKKFTTQRSEQPLEPPSGTLDHLLWEMYHENPRMRPTAQEALDRLNKLIGSNGLKT